MPNQTYSIIDLGTLGGSESRAWAINNNGQVVGDAQTSSGQFRAFQFTDINTNQQLDPGEMQDLGIVGNALESRGRDINNNGQVVGFLPTSTGSTRAFLWNSTSGMQELTGSSNSALSINNNGVAVGFFKVNQFQFHASRWQNAQAFPLITPIDKSSWATGINDSGQIVGYTDINGNPIRAFLYESGEMKDARDLGTLNSTSTTRAWDINNQSQVVGQSGSKAFFWSSNGGIKDLGSLGSGSSQALAINNQTQVVGKSNDSAFIWRDSNSNGQPDPGEMIDLNTLLPSNAGWSLTEAQDINDAGQIVGTGIINGQTHAFLLTPTLDASALSISDTWVAVGKTENEAIIKFTVSLSEPSTEEVKVKFKTLKDSSDTATSSLEAGQDPNKDYEAIKENEQGNKNTLIFAPGQRTKDIEIKVFGGTAVTDKIFEYFARDTAYKTSWKKGDDVDKSYEDWGYTVDKTFGDVTDFYAVGLTSDETFSVQLFDPSPNASIVDGIAKGTIQDLNKPPVLAIRGTVPSEILTLYDDANPDGIGRRQYNKNRAFVENWLNQVSNPTASGAKPVKPNITGHSLGGALTQ